MVVFNSYVKFPEGKVGANGVTSILRKNVNEFFMEFICSTELKYTKVTIYNICSYADTRS